jgi:DNA damage-binding protein 1
MRLQSAMAPLVRSAGQIPFMKYRAFKNAVREADEPFRFVDGELIEQFLNLPVKDQEQVASVLGDSIGVEGIKGMVEALKRLH